MPEPTSALHSMLVGNVVTAGDAADGRVLLRTYDQVLLYEAPDDGATLEGFPQWPVRAVRAPFEPQSEALTWAHDGCGFYTAGERVGDLWQVPCRR